MPAERTIGFRPTPRQLQVLEQWIASHQEEGGEPLSTADALRAAVDALEQMERRRERDRGRSKRWRASEAELRDMARRFRDGHPNAGDIGDQDEAAQG